MNENEGPVVSEIPQWVLEAVPAWWVEQHAGLLVGVVAAVFVLLGLGYVVLRRRETRGIARTSTANSADRGERDSAGSHRGGRSG